MNKSTLGRSATLLLLTSAAAHGQLLISDNYTAVNSGSGFALGSGANSGINPPTTRLTGSLAPNMRYIATDATKVASSYTISANALKVGSAANSGRLSLSTDGTTAYDFGSALGTSLATAANPIVYDVTISMDNDSTAAANPRFSFALGTAENNANFWDFGIQLYKGSSGDTFYTIGKRIDRVSYTTATDSTGTTSDINAPITTTAAGTFGTSISFLMRVTDAGAESTTFNSRVQLSMDGGSSWFYDTDTDSALTSGFRFDTGSRYFMWDIAGSAIATYDNFSVTLVTPAVPEPSAFSFALLAGYFGLVRRFRK
jgi:hypothetical protein